MDFHDFLRARRSIRRFKAGAIADSVLERILTTASCAPSAHDLQPWRFVVIRDPAYRTQLARALTTKMQADMQAEGAAPAEIAARRTRSVRRIDQAPLLILLGRALPAVRADTEEEALMAVQSVAAAGLQLLLAAQAEGLGASWCCWPLYARAETRTALDLPQDFEPQALFFIGSAADEPAPRERKPLQAVVSYR